MDETNQLQTNTKKPPMSRGRAVLIAITALGVLIILAIGIYTVANGLLPKKFFDASSNPTVEGATTEETFLVLKVVDGDTLKVQTPTGVQTVRLLGIDTPETKDPRKPVQCFGEAAHQELQKLVEGKRVRLEIDTTQGDHDRYQRLLRFVYLQDNTNVNATMVSEGFAFAYRQYPTVQTPRLIQLEKEAEQSRKGLWGACTVHDEKGREQTNATGHKHPKTTKGHA